MATTQRYRRVRPERTATLNATRRGSILYRLIISPQSATPGNVGIRDGDTGQFTQIYTGGTSTDPVTIELGLRARDPAGWQIETGVDVICIAVFQGP